MMRTAQAYDITFRLDGHLHHGTMHVDEIDEGERSVYQARIDSSPLKGTHGGTANEIALALDFLNLAMQAEGADEIVFTPQTM